jgi:hypothetical protein
MHPIFSRRAWLAAYLATVAVGAILMAVLLRVAGRLAWLEAAELAGPLTLLYAFVCLAPWYLCRMLPLGTTHPLKIAVEHLGAAVLATGLWVAAAQLLGRIFAIDTGPAVIPYLTAVGLLLYCLSVALHYMRWPCRTRARPPFRRARRRTARAEGADQSAFSVQQS